MSTTQYDAKTFTWEGNRGTCFASDIDFKPEPYLSVVNGNTGNGYRFKAERVIRDKDDDIAYWEYVSITGKFSLRIFND